jgi:hypothetical protein
MRLRSAESAALRTYHQSNALCGKRVHAVEAGHRQGICTRSRVLCLVALGVSISIPRFL